MSLNTILLILLIFVALGAIGGVPAFNLYGQGRGWGTSGGLTVLFIILLVLVLSGRIG